MSSFKSLVYRRYPGALVGFYRGPGGGNHAHLVDRGTRKRPHPRTGTSGIMPGNHFWTETFEQDSGKAKDKVLIGIQGCVNRINNRR
ncbi:MAG: hypothetical protein LKI39_02685 [Bacteroides sp.]|nr:hypothetical protein [Bacteroides sp.]